MNVYLGPKLDRFVAEMMRSGLYQSQSEVLRESLRLLREKEELRKLRLQELRKELAVGVRQLDAGQGRLLDDSTFDRVRAMGQAKARASRRKAS